MYCEWRRQVPHERVSTTTFIALIIVVTNFYFITKKNHSKRCHRCVVIYEKHKNVLQYKESECEEMDHFKASALSSRSTIIKSDQNRGVAFTQSHPNMSRSKISTSDHNNYRSNDDSRTNNDCKQKSSMKFIFFLWLLWWNWWSSNPSEKIIYFASLNSNCIRIDS